MEKKKVNDYVYCGGVKVDSVEERGIPKEIEEEVNKNNVTEIVFILDRSGSMAGMEKDTIGGFNSMIEKQKALDGTVYVSTVTFSNCSTVLHDRECLQNVLPLTEDDYQVGGGTALLDAVGDTINHIDNIHKYIRKEDVPNKTLFVITTDGMENASRKYTFSKIKEMINCQQEKYGWEFLFVAANIDVAETADSMGIRQDCATSYCVREDTSLFYNEISDTIKMCRSTGRIRKDWAGKLKEKSKEKDR